MAASRAYFKLAMSQQKLSGWPLQQVVHNSKVAMSVTTEAEWVVIAARSPCSKVAVIAQGVAFVPGQIFS